MITIDYIKQKVHEGDVHTANFNKSAVANAATTSLRVKANTLSAHVTISVQATTSFIMRSYSGTTYTTAGTAPDGTILSVFNRVVGLNDVDADVTFDATVNVLGTKRGNLIVPGGAGPKSTGGSGDSGIETQILPGEDLLLVFECLAGDGQTGDINVVLDWCQSTYTAPTVLPQLALTALSVEDENENAQTLIPEFDTAKAEYTIADVEWSIAKLVIDGTESVAPTFTRGEGTVSLEVGANVLNVDAYKTGYEACRYAIGVTRKDTSLLSTLTASYDTVVGEDTITTQLITFEPYTFAYSATVESTIDTIDVAATAPTGYTIAYSVNVVEGVVTLEVGENVITATVTDDATEKSDAVYTITITRAEV